MTNIELLLQINCKAKENIMQLAKTEIIEKISKCITFSDDLQLWLSCCNDFSKYTLVKEAQAKCVESIVLSAQGFYKESIFTLRQFLEHMLFAIFLSTNDYKYRLWQAGECDMSWAQIMDENNGIFGINFVRMYAAEVEIERCLELRSIAKNVYRECSEFVHGNFERLSFFPENIVFDEQALSFYITYFESIRYVISMAMFIRFRDVLNDAEVLRKLEPIIADNIGRLPEVNLLFSREEEKSNE